MIRGAQKKVIVIKTADSEIFEEAYFVLRRDRESNRGDMVNEANKLVEGLEESEKREKKALLLGRLSSIAFMIFGGGIGALAVSAVLLFVA